MHRQCKKIVSRPQAALCAGALVLAGCGGAAAHSNTVAASSCATQLQSAVAQMGTILSNRVSPALTDFSSSAPDVAHDQAVFRQALSDLRVNDTHVQAVHCGAGQTLLQQDVQGASAAYVGAVQQLVTGVQTLSPAAVAQAVQRVSDGNALIQDATTQLEAAQK